MLRVARNMLALLSSCMGIHLVCYISFPLCRKTGCLLDVPRHEQQSVCVVHRMATGCIGAFIVIFHRLRFALWASCKIRLRLMETRKKKKMAVSLGFGKAVMGISRCCSILSSFQEFVEDKM